MPKFFELFAGAGGMTMGFEAAGWECVGHAEIEPHARAVLRHKWPDVPLHGDVAQLDGTTLPPFDLLTFGAPCQDLSIAGKRAGMAEGSGTRSSLFFEAIRIWKESTAPLALYENVLGAYSSNNGNDFAAVLSAFVGAAVPVPADGWRGAGVASGPAGIAAWRTLDLQHFGWNGDTTPQRRRRVFVLGTRTGSVDPAEVLLVADGLLGHLATGGEAREGVAPDTGAGVAGAGVLTYDARGNGEGVSDSTLSGDHQNRVTDYTALVLRNREGKPGGGKGPLVSEAFTSNDQVVFTQAETFRMVAFGEYDTDGTASAIKARDFKDATDLAVGSVGVPRRLTPRETEALMGWPRNHTEYGTDENGKVYALSDTARYKLCGNGCGSPVLAWIGMRLKVGLDNTQSHPHIPCTP